MKPNYNQKDLVGGYKKQPFPFFFLFFFFLYNTQAYPIKHSIPFQKKRKENRIANVPRAYCSCFGISQPLLFLQDPSIQEVFSTSLHHIHPVCLRRYPNHLLNCASRTGLISVDPVFKGSALGQNYGSRLHFIFNLPFLWPLNFQGFPLSPPGFLECSLPTALMIENQ